MAYNDAIDVAPASRSLRSAATGRKKRTPRQRRTPYLTAAGARHQAVRAAQNPLLVRLQKKYGLSDYVFCMSSERRWTSARDSLSRVPPAPNPASPLRANIALQFFFLLRE